MFIGMVEADTGEILNIRHPGGETGGNPSLMLSTAIRNYCDGDSSVESDWIKRLEAHGQESLCSFCDGLIKSFVEGDWEYEEDYDLYLQRSSENKMSHEDFLKNVERRENAWTDIQSLMNCARHLLELIKIDQPTDLDWYDIDSLIHDLETLLNTLSILAERDATEVRVLIY